MMFCQKCGKQIPDTANFCDGCGAPVNRGAPRPVGGQPQTQTPAKQKKKSSALSTLVTIGIVVFLVLAVISTATNMSIPELIGMLRTGEKPETGALYELETALQERDETVVIRKDKWDTEICAWENVRSFIEDQINEVPERYYVDWKNSELRYSGDDSENPFYKLTIAYFEELDNEQARKKIDDAADAILRQIPSGASDWEKARLIHDALIRHVTYKEGAYDQTIYGALAEGEAVCNGYAMAYEYLMTKAGIPCETVIGYSSQLNAALSSSIGATRHAWNIVTLRDTNGVEKSAYVDVTWDDPDLKSTDGEDYISYNWFCVTQEDLNAEGRSTQDAAYDLSRWNLNDDDLNYYVYTDSVIREYDLERIAQIMRRQLDEGNNILSVRMADMDVYYDALFSLGNDGEISTLCTDLGLEWYGYEFTYDYIGNGILCLNIYVNYPERS